jgi:hypothetical protein
MSSVFGKNIQNLGGGSVGLGLSPAVANINMANNSIVNLNQINGQTFPAYGGPIGSILTITTSGVMTWNASGSVGATGPQGPTGPAQVVGGVNGEISFNLNGSSAGDLGLVYNVSTQVATICGLSIVNTLSTKNFYSSNGITTGSATNNTIGNVSLNSGNISNASSTTNNIGAWTLTSSNLYVPNLSLATTGAISTLTNICSSIGGVLLSNNTLNATGISTIAGNTFSNSFLGIGVTSPLSNLDVSGTSLFRGATTICGLITVSAALIQNNLSVSGSANISNLATTNTLSSVYVFISNNLSASNVYISNALNVSGLFTVSAVQVVNGLSVSGLTTLSGLNVSNAINSSGYISSTSGLSSGLTTCNTIGGITLSNNTVYSTNISSLTSFNGTSVIINNPSALIGIGNSISLTGTQNIVFGTSAGFNFTGSNLISIGQTAGNGNNSILIGHNSGISNTGAYVVGIGEGALSNNTGSNVNGIGYNSLRANTGNNVDALGSNTAQSNTGSYVLALGYGAAVLNSNSNVIAIGCNAGRGNANSNMIYLGNNGTSYGGTTSNNSMIVYSTNASTPFLYGDLSGIQLGIGKNPTTTLDVLGSSYISGTLSAGYINVTSNLLVYGTSTLCGTVTVSGNINISGITTSQNLNVLSTINTNTLNSIKTNLTTLNVSSLASISYVIIQQTLSTNYQYGSNLLISSTISASNVTVSGTFQSFTTNICGLATISGAQIINSLNSGSIYTPYAVITSLSSTNLSISGSTILNTLSVNSTISAFKFYTPTATISLFTTYGANVSGYLTVSGTFQSITTNICGLATISGAQIINSLNSGSIYTPYSIITSLSSTNVTISGSTILNTLSVNSTISAFNFYTPTATISALTTYGTTVSGNLNVSGTAYIPTLNGLKTFGGISVLFSQISSIIYLGTNISIGGTYVNAHGISAGLANTGQYVDAIGFNAASSNTGSNVVAIGNNAGANNSGLTGIFIGQNAGLNNATTGSNVISIGQNAGSNNKGSYSVFLGSNAGTGVSNVGNVIAIGTNAGSNNQYSNSIFLGSNPGYANPKPNTFILYSISTGFPTLQADLSFRYLGIGMSPSYSLDVSGTARFPTALINTLNVSTVNFQSSVTINSLTICAASGAILTVCGQTLFNNLSFTSINGINWSSPAGGNYILSVDSTKSNISWVAPNSISVSNWASNAAVSNVNLSSYNLFGISTFNSISAVFVGTSGQIGLGQSVLANNPSINNIAFGISAGATSTPSTSYSNNIFLGSNPGGLSNVSNAFIVYSQVSGLPLIYGDTSNKFVSIGSSTIPSGYTFNVSGLAYVQGLNVVNTLSVGSLYVPGTVSFSGLIIINNISTSNVYISNNLSVAGTTLHKGTTTICGAFITSNTVNLSGLTTTTSSTFYNTAFLSISTSSLVSSNYVYRLTSVVNNNSLSDAPSIIRDRGAGNTIDFKRSSVLNLSTGYNSNYQLITYNPSSDYTGGPITQIAFGNSNSYIRWSTGSPIESWSSWVQYGIAGSDQQVMYNAVGGLSGNGGLTYNYNTNTLNTSNFSAVSNTLSNVTINTSLVVSCSSTFKNPVNLTSINGVLWPPVSGTANQILTLNATGSAAWTTPGQVNLTQWAANPAVATVNINSNDIQNIVKFNSVAAIINTTSSQVGIGVNVLSNNNATNVIAFGNKAGSNNNPSAINSNCIYLGSNPGTYLTSCNTLLVYSTTVGTPAVQVDMGQNFLGVGMIPTNALDVTGNARISSNFTTLGKVVVGSITTPCNYSINVNESTNTSGYVAFYGGNTAINPQFGIGYDKGTSGLVVKVNSNTGTNFTGTALYVSANSSVGIGTTSPVYTLDVSGKINTNTAVITPSLTVNSNTTLSGTLTLPTIPSTAYLNLSKVLTYNSTTGSVNYSTLNINTLGAADSNTMNANWVTSGGGVVTWNYASSNVTGTNHIVAGPVNTSFGSIGLINIGSDSGSWTINFTNTNNWQAAYWVPSSIPSTGYISGGSWKIIDFNTVANQIGSNWIFICSINPDNRSLKWGPGFVTIPSGGVYDSTKEGKSWNTLGSASNVALGSNSVITGATSILIGSNTAGSNITASNVIAIGTNAATNANYSNTIYIGSNAGYSPQTSNTLVIPSTNASFPTLQADLSNRYLGVGMAPSNALDVSGNVRVNGNVNSLISVSGTTNSSLTLSPAYASTYYSLFSTATGISITFPSTTPPQGTYWVVKNNSVVNYTLNATNGVFNAGSNSYYLQAGIGITVVYSGTQTNGCNAYYTF